MNSSNEKRKCQSIKYPRKQSSIPQKKTDLVDTDDAKDFVNIIFNAFSNKNKIRSAGRISSKGAVFADKLKKLLEIFLNNLFSRRVLEIG